MRLLGTLLLMWVTGFALGCSGTIFDTNDYPAGSPGARASGQNPFGPGGDPNDPNNPLGPGADPNDPNDPLGPGDGDGDGDEDKTVEEAMDEEEALTIDVPAPGTRVARLTHDQWRNTVEDLLQISDASPFAETLRDDASNSGYIFENNTTALSVDEALWGGYQRAAGEIAEHVATNATRLDKILPADPGDEDARAQLFIDAFGLKAHRRPLTAAERAEYHALYMAAPPLYDGMTDFDAGIRLLIEAFLQSPYFIYRVEESEDVVDDLIPLDSYEVASRLSYMLWNTMPDQALFDAAADDLLLDSNEIAAQAARMLDDARAEDMVYDFHRQLLEVEKAADANPSPAFYPDAPADFGQSAVTEHEMFVRDVYDRGGSYKDLLTSNETFVNDDLAEIYGLSGSYGSGFEAATLDDTERRGIFTQVAFLAANATSVDPDPIHRGVFLTRRIACNTLAAPPDDIPPLPAPMGRTNRETVEDHTQDPTTICAGCHATVINPFGFPFENYDAIGGHRTMDNGFPVDASTEPSIGGELLMVMDALELADTFAENEAVHQCYAKHWIEFAYGRPAAAEDDSLKTRLGLRSQEGKKTIKELIVGLVETQSFMTRSRQELP